MRTAFINLLFSAAAALGIAVGPESDIGPVVVRSFRDLEAAVEGRIAVEKTVTFDHEIRINGTEIVGGTLSGNNSMRLFSVYDGSLILRNVHVRNGFAPNGGAVYAVGGNVTIIGSLVEECVAEWDGGAIYVENGNLTIKNSVFRNNGAYDDAGVAYVSRGQISVLASLFERNWAFDNGGCFYWDDDDDLGGSHIEASRFWVNYAGDRGGDLRCRVVSPVFIKETEFNRSTALRDGGSLYVEGPLVVSKATFLACSAGDDGGAIAMEDGQLNVTSTSWTQCSASDDGGALVVGSSSVIFEDIVAESNVASGSGGFLSVRSSVVYLEKASFFRDAALEDGGVLYARRSTTIVAKNIIADENSAGVDGGFIYLDDGAISLDHGNLTRNHADGRGGVAVSSGLFLLDDVTASNNSAAWGGFFAGGGALNLTTVSLTRNFAVFGGVLYFASDVVARGGRMEANDAVEGAAIYVDTGTKAMISGFTASHHTGASVVVAGPEASVKLTDVDSISNRVPGNGAFAFVEYAAIFEAINVRSSEDRTDSFGAFCFVSKLAEASLLGVQISGSVGTAVYAQEASYVQIRDSVFQGNQGPDGGAIFASDTKAVDVTNATFNTNTAASRGGALYVVGETSVSVAATSFYENSANQGASVAAFGGSRVKIQDVRFQKSRALADGGALFADDAATITAKATLLKENSAMAAGGAASVGANSKLIIDGDVVVSNNTAQTGGAIWLASTSSLETRGRGNVYTSNVALTDGGVFYMNSNASITLHDGDTAMDNRAMAGGGGIAMFTSLPAPVLPPSMNAGGNDAVYGPVLATPLATVTASHHGVEGSNEFFQSPIVVTAVDALGQSVPNTGLSSMARITTEDPSIELRGTTLLFFQNGRAQTDVGFRIASSPGVNVTLRVEMRTSPLPGDDEPVRSLFTMIEIPLRRCRVGEVLVDDGTTCQLCDGHDQVSFDPTKTTCDACPSHTSCVPTSTTKSEDSGRVLRPDRGYWRSTTYSMNVRLCPWKRACAGGVDLWDTPSSCTKKRSGVLCARCDDGRVQNRRSGSCKKCTRSLIVGGGSSGSSAARTGRIVVWCFGVTGLLVLLVLLICYCRRKDNGARTAWQQSKKSVGGLGSKFKLWIVMLQIVADYSTNFDFVGFPKQFKILAGVVGLIKLGPRPHHGPILPPDEPLRRTAVFNIGTHCRRWGRRRYGSVPPLSHDVRSCPT